MSRSQMINGFESEMDQWMRKREELSHKADNLKQQRQDLLQATEVCIIMERKRMQLHGATCTDLTSFSTN